MLFGACGITKYSRLFQSESKLNHRAGVSRVNPGDWLVEFANRINFQYTAPSNIHRHAIR
jgi:hypothetical protein